MYAAREDIRKHTGPIASGVSSTFEVCQTQPNCTLLSLDQWIRRRYLRMHFQTEHRVEDGAMTITDSISKDTSTYVHKRLRYVQWKDSPRIWQARLDNDEEN